MIYYINSRSTASVPLTDHLWISFLALDISTTRTLVSSDGAVFTKVEEPVKDPCFGNERHSAQIQAWVADRKFQNARGDSFGISLSNMFCQIHYKHASVVPKHCYILLQSKTWRSYLELAKKTRLYMGENEARPTALKKNEKHFCAKTRTEPSEYESV